MPTDVLETAYSRMKKLAKRIIKNYNDAIELIKTMPHMWYNEIGNIRAIVDNFEHELKGHYRLHSEDIDYRPPLKISLDPSFQEHLASLGNDLRPIVVHLRQWPFDTPVLETILLDLEQLFMEEVPHLQAALTQDELDEQDFRQLYGNRIAEPNVEAPATCDEAVRKWLHDDGRDSSYFTSSSEDDSSPSSSSDGEGSNDISSNGTHSDDSGYAGDHEGAGGVKVGLDLTGVDDDDDDEGMVVDHGRDIIDLTRDNGVMDTGDGVIDLTQDNSDDGHGPIVLSDMDLDD
ncbi:hypothetical protein BT96DRAFT_994713 [Gymnopus androsaceus JB14]|uniref:Uncharacterized protein n=1 Tax=Gymnopus androsaceus JB14 TaxID=1447944 RepID=A0A6A4HMM1_9AGAR|nr:hypothetical protein BT96DRAFT_994713 [Gymnopus androsaceus JB14]